MQTPLLYACLRNKPIIISALVDIQADIAAVAQVNYTNIIQQENFLLIS